MYKDITYTIIKMQRREKRWKYVGTVFVYYSHQENIPIINKYVLANRVPKYIKTDQNN